MIGGLEESGGWEGGDKRAYKVSHSPQIPPLSPFELEEKWSLCGEGDSG